MNLSLELYKVIQSLDKKQKQRFTQLTSMQGNADQKRYYYLYKLLEGQKEFSEDLLKDIFLSKYTAKQYIDDKQYLTNQLLMLLHLAPNAEDKERNCLYSLSHIPLLLKAGAFGLAKNEIGKALSLAQQQNMFAYEYKALEHRHTLLTIKSAGMEELLLVNEQIAHVIEKMKRVNLIARYTIKVRWLKQKFIHTNLNRYRVECAALLHEWLSIEKQPLDDKVIFISESNLLIALYAAANKNEEAVEVIKESVKLVKADLGKEQLAPYLYLAWVTNAITLTLALNKVSDSSRILKELEAFSSAAWLKTNASLLDEWQATALRLRVEILFYQRKYKDIVLLQNRIKETGAKQSMFSDNRLPLITKLAWSYLQLNDKSTAYTFCLQYLAVPEVKENYSYNLMYYCIKALVEVSDKEFITADNTLRSLNRLIRRNSNDLANDNLIKNSIYACAAYLNTGRRLKQLEKQLVRLGSLPTNHIGALVNDYMGKFMK